MGIVVDTNDGFSKSFKNKFDVSLLGFPVGFKLENEVRKDGLSLAENEEGDEWYKEDNVDGYMDEFCVGGDDGVSLHCRC